MSIYQEIYENNIRNSEDLPDECMGSVGIRATTCQNNNKLKYEK